MTDALPCWACSLPPVFIAGSGVPVHLCSSCARYVRGPVITTVSPAQSLERARADRDQRSPSKEQP